MHYVLIFLIVYFNILIFNILTNIQLKVVTYME